MSLPAPPPGTDLLVVDDPSFDAHRASGYHPERPERLAAARRALAAAAVSTREVPAREATREELGRVHTPAYLERLESLKDQRAQLDPDTFVAPRSVEAARRAAGGLIDLVDGVLEGQTTKGLALLRPPGHHARPASGMGFCLLNSVAAAAAHARARGIDRVLVLDWDVHHGNGTQEIFWRDPSVLYVSTHQHPFYPGTGIADERGEGEGRGFTVNVPLLAGGDDGTYRAAFERVILPIVEEYAPELVLVSAGFDAASRDPLANMDLGADAFGWMAAELAGAAKRSAGGRMVMALEGGYDLPSLEAGLASAIGGMVTGKAREIARRPDAADVGQAAAAAHACWARVG